jgi:hypothetical protein
MGGTGQKHGKSPPLSGFSMPRSRFRAGNCVRLKERQSLQWRQFGNFGYQVRKPLPAALKSYYTTVKQAYNSGSQAPGCTVSPERYDQLKQNPVA